MAYRTGRQVVDLVLEDLKPRDILTRSAFLNAIRVNTAIGGSTNAPPHLQAIARHAGVQLSIDDWQQVGFEVPTWSPNGLLVISLWSRYDLPCMQVGFELPLLTNVQPSGKYLCEAFHRAGGVPAVMAELLVAGMCLVVGWPIAR